jgi:hypothetical protein
MESFSIYVHLRSQHKKSINEEENIENSYRHFISSSHEFVRKKMKEIWANL